MAKIVSPVCPGRGSKAYAVENASPTRRFVSRIVLVSLLAVVGTLVGISSASRTVLQSESQATAPAVFATLNYIEGQVSISGSVDQLFQSSIFVGTTTTQKTARLLPQTNVLDIANSFSAERTRIAALRMEAANPVDAPQSPVPVLPRANNVDAISPISVAAIDPNIGSSALEAIGSVIPGDPSIPLPSALTDQLAYLRANTPTTERAVSQYSEREQWCLATGIYFEARGESYRGQVAVAQVILNRVKHRQYPDTICGVVFQNQSWKNRCQFSFACDGIPERVTEPAAWAVAEEITTKVTNGSIYLSEVANATHYHANYVYPHWAPRMTRLTKIGAHIFYRFRS